MLVLFNVVKKHFRLRGDISDLMTIFQYISSEKSTEFMSRSNFRVERSRARGRLPNGPLLLSAITPKYGDGHVASHRRGAARARAKSNAILRAPVQHERVSLLHP